MMINHQIVKWIIFWVGASWEKWPSFGLWPKNKSTPLALYLGLLQFISKPWKCHHRNHKKSFKSFVSLFGIFSLYDSSFLLHSDSCLCKKNNFCHQFFWIPFFNSRIVSFWMFFVTWLSFTQGVFNWRATPTHSTLIGWTEWQWMRTNSDWPIRRINFKYSMK